ncbi:phospholipid scramblase-related protein [Haloactinospora alba]|uniref:phospholipid scramblase-related protein n=1 Tax=Haloactinospora alba TaxID=405555 RepID=UPI001150D488|nr:phospholipid scramblase-related protein [Haloactinospora alba]
MQDLFHTSPIVVKQPKRFLVDESEYNCFDQYTRHLAHVHEVDLGAGMHALRFLANNTTGFARKVMVNDAWRRPRLYIEKSWAMFTATTTVAWPNGTPIGYIDQDFAFFKAGFRLLDPFKRHIGTIQGNFWGRNFQITDANEHEVARVNQQFPDVGEFFTPANTYVLWQRYPALPEPLNTLVVSSGIVIDLVLAEGHW